MCMVMGKKGRAEGQGRSKGELTSAYETKEEGRNEVNEQDTEAGCMGQVPCR